MATDGNGPMDPKTLEAAVHRMLSDNIPILVGGTRWECPTCGNKPQNVEPGVPEAIKTQMHGDEAQYHCGPCFATFQAEEQVRKIREHVPALRPVVV